MSRTPMQKLEVRVAQLRCQAMIADEGNPKGLLRDAPVVTLKQIVILDQRDEKHVRRAFPSALERHRVKQLRAYATNCRRKARALRKLAIHYVYRPGKTEAEMAAAS
ncbi:MAG: hypothetical protein Q8R30_02340 [bacterium]|nr:hypothetical protein [bacterium]MDZ4286072.1 hypothetical protein [Candidatus Sungbacteria bacterium]